MLNHRAFLRAGIGEFGDVILNMAWFWWTE
jgi:hypothetical protein